VAPQRPDLVLSSYIPDIELCVFIRYGFDVEADSGNGSDVLFELEVVEDGCTVCQLMPLDHGARGFSLVLPAASKPSINRRISLDPKILSSSFEMPPPIVTRRLRERQRLVGDLRVRISMVRSATDGVHVQRLKCDLVSVRMAW